MYVLATLLIVVLDISYSHYLLLATVVLYKNFNQCCNRPTNYIFCSFVVLTLLPCMYLYIVHCHSLYCVTAPGRGGGPPKVEYPACVSA